MKSSTIRTATAALAASMLTVTLATSPAPANATAAPQCAATRMAFAAVPAGAAAGSSYALLVFTSVASAPCTLYGYPGVAMAPSPAGPQTGHAATRNALVQPTLVTLTPGQAAFALLSITDVGNYPRKAHCAPASVAVARAYPPGATVRLAALDAATVCANRHVHGVAVTAVTTNRAAFAALQAAKRGTPDA